MNNVAGGHMSCLRDSFKVPKNTDYQKKSGKVFDKRDANPRKERDCNARGRRHESEVVGLSPSASKGFLLDKFK